jgi:hypothetical protein
MAEAAVVQHIDRRACDLHLGPAFEPWAEAMTRTTAGHPFLVRRLQEWSQLLADSGPTKRIRNTARMSLKQGNI